MLQERKETEHMEKRSCSLERLEEKIEIEDIDDLIFRDSFEIKTHSER